MILTAIALIVISFIIGFVVRGFFNPKNNKFLVVKKPKCINNYCNAFRFTTCDDGRCVYHCSLYCYCIKRKEDEIKEEKIVQTALSYVKR